MVTFEQTRDVLAAATGRPAAPWGWENADLFVVVVDYGDGGPPLGEPDRLVDKRTGRLREVAGLLGRAPVPGLRPIGDAPR
jgi:hypothetical protein